MEEKKQAGSIEQMLSRRAEFVSIRDKADGAIQAMDIAINDLRRLDEQQEQEKEPAETGEGPYAPSTGNGYAHNEDGAGTFPEAAKDNG